MILFNLYTILCLLIMFNCHAIGSIEMVEDGITTEEEEMVKALELSKTYFWRNMVEKWCCSEDTLKNELIDFLELGSMENLIKFCNEWKMMALAVDEYLKSCEKWGDLKKYVKIFSAKKPRFQYNKKKLLMSSAMTAIVLICQALLLERGNRNYLKEIKIDFVNKHKFNLVVQPKDEKFHDLNQLSYEEQKPNQSYKTDYLSFLQFYVSTIINAIEQKILNTQEAHRIELKALIEEKEQDLRQSNLPSYERSAYQNAIREFQNAIGENSRATLQLFKEAHDSYEEMWGLVYQIGIDLNAICAGWKSFDKQQNDENVKNFILKNIEYNGQSSKKEDIEKHKDYAIEFLQKVKNKIESKINFQEVGEGLGQLINLYKLKSKIHAAKVKDPCQEAKLRVKP